MDHRAALLATIATLSLAACGSETTSDPGGTGGAGGMDDGKLHPEPNGVRISEEAACQRMHGALDTKAKALQCTKTLRPCPSFLRTTYAPQCSEFDEGAVQGCIDHWNAVFNCNSLDETDCVAVHYPEDAPAGCP